MFDERKRLEKAGDILLKKQMERLAKGGGDKETAAQQSLVDALLPAGA